MTTTFTGPGPHGKKDRPAKMAWTEVGALLVSMKCLELGVRPDVPNVRSSASVAEGDVVLIPMGGSVRLDDGQNVSLQNPTKNREVVSA